MPDRTASKAQQASASASASTTTTTTTTPIAIDLRLLRVEEFLAARSLSPNSQKAYRRELERFFSWIARPFNDITTRQIVQYKTYLEKSLVDSSVNRALSVLKCFFSWLIEAYPNSISHNPTVAVNLNTLPLPPANDLNDKEVEALWKAVELSTQTKQRDLALLAVLAHGLRASEVSALNVGDYDGTRLFIRKGKDDSSGTVPLSLQARNQLDEYLEWRRQQGERCHKSRPLFLSHSPINPGVRLGYQGIYYTIKELGERAQIVNLTPHRLRHTYATKLLLMGMDSLHARTLTRHKSEANFKRYAKRALSDAAEQAFYKAMGEEPPPL